jgi:hypothetical protein
MCVTGNVLTIRRLGYNCTVYLNMYCVGGDHPCAKDAAHIYGGKSLSRMIQLWPLQGSPKVSRLEV